MTRTRMRFGALVTAGVLSLGLGACADDTDGSSSDPTTAADAADTESDETTAEDDAASGDDAAGSEDGSAGGDAAEGEEIPVADFMAMLQEPGEETLSSYTMTMSMDAGGQQMQVDGAMDLSSGSPAMQLTMGLPDVGEIDLIIVDGAVFMSMPGLVPDGKYIEAPPELTTDLEDLEEIDVSAMWDTWEEGAQQVVFLGEGDVDGTQMRQYEITVDQESIDQALETAAAELGDDAAATSAMPTGPVVYQVWLDDDNLIRQMTMDIDGSLMEMTMNNWGEPQDITAPSADDLVDPSELGGATG